MDNPGTIEISADRLLVIVFVISDLIVSSPSHRREDGCDFGQSLPMGLTSLDHTSRYASGIITLRYARDLAHDLRGYIYKPASPTGAASYIIEHPSIVCIHLTIIRIAYLVGH